MESKDLRKAGLKVTGPRLKILEILEGSPTRHMSAEGIYKRLIESNEDIGLATVYRVLTQFQAAGLVSRHHFEDGMAVFELNQGTHHDHIVCLDCGRVEEFIDESIEERQEAIAQAPGVRAARPRHDAVWPLPQAGLPASRPRTAIRKSTAEDAPRERRSGLALSAARLLVRIARHLQHFARVLARLAGDFLAA